MIARIYQPARTAMQSGTANTREWHLEYVPEKRKPLDPLMGWTGSTETTSQVRMRFDSKEEAIAYCERHGIAFQVFDPHPRKPVIRPGGYGDNFAANRRFGWTH
jgi:ETC complex I subunit conserved region